MQSPALGVAWELWRPYRWWVLAAAAYLLVLVLVYHSVDVQSLARSLGQALVAEALAQKALEVEDLARLIGYVSALPLGFGLIWMLVVFGYGMHTNLTLKDSSFPARMFVLPVRTRALVGWPMIYGTLAVALTWISLAEGVLRPCGIATPSGLLAVVAAVLLVWIQAISWSSFGASWLKAAVAVLMLSAVVAAPLVGAAFDVPRAILLLLLAGLLPVGYAVAVVGVSRARCGDVREWYWWSEWTRQIRRRLPRRRPFASAARAQVWFEWRRHGAVLPLMVICVLPFCFLPLFAEKSDPTLTARLLLIASFLPPFLAGSAATMVGKMNPWVKDYYGVPPFTAGRPLSCGALVAAKLKMAALSTLITWGLVLVMAPLALLASGHWQDVAAWWRNGSQVYPPAHLCALLLLGLTGLLIYTWKRLVENLFIGLTGRGWVIHGSVNLSCVLFLVLTLLGAWLYYHPAYHETFFAVIPWLMGGLVLLKLLAAAWACRAASRRGLVATQTLVRLLSLWFVAASGLVVALWYLVSNTHVSLHAIALGVMLFLPLSRLLVAPLALAWNRHR